MQQQQNMELFVVVYCNINFFLFIYLIYVYLPIVYVGKGTIGGLEAA